MDCFKIFDLPYNATEDQIKSKYRQLALEWHPDKNPHRIEEATTKFKQIGDAYDKLLDPTYRAKFRPSKSKKSDAPKRNINPGNMSVVDAAPPKFDLWGKPLSTQERTLWDQANKIDLTKVDPKTLDKDNSFIDTQRYEDDSGIFLR